MQINISPFVEENTESKLKPRLSFISLSEKKSKLHSPICQTRWWIVRWDSSFFQVAYCLMEEVDRHYRRDSLSYPVCIVLKHNNLLPLHSILDGCPSFSRASCKILGTCWHGCLFGFFVNSFVISGETRQEILSMGKDMCFWMCVSLEKVWRQWLEAGGQVNWVLMQCLR